MTREEKDFVGAPREKPGNSEFLEKRFFSETIFCYDKGNWISVQE